MQTLILENFIPIFSADGSASLRVVWQCSVLLSRKNADKTVIQAVRAAEMPCQLFQGERFETENKNGGRICFAWSGYAYRFCICRIGQQNKTLLFTENKGVKYACGASQFAYSSHRFPNWPQIDHWENHSRNTTGH